MPEYNQVLINTFIFLEVLFALLVALVLGFASKYVLKLEADIKEQTGQVVEILVMLRLEIRKFNKVAGFLKTLKKYRHIKQLVTGVIEILNIAMLLAPGANSLKIRRFLTLELLKSSLGLLKV